MKRFLTLFLATAVSLMIVIAVIAAHSKVEKGSVNRPETATGPAANATVKIVGFEFQPKSITVAPGTTVEWVNEGTRHSVDADDGSFKSEVLKQGDHFTHTFDKAGTYPYHCRFHGEAGGKDMAGKVIVK